MLVDAFLYNGEADMAELRLRTLNEVADLFVAVVADVSHAGEDQEFQRLEREPRFAPWRHKLQSIIVTDTPRFWVHDDLAPHEGPNACLHLWSQHTTAGCWHVEASGLCPCTEPRPYHKSIPRTPYFQKRERHQRDAIARLRADDRLDDDTLVYVSDVDEIWDPDITEQVEKALDDAQWVVLEQRMHGFALDYLHPFQPWLGTTVTRRRDLAPQLMRDARGDIPAIADGGVHLSWFGTQPEREKKLRSFSHGELVGRVDLAHCYEHGTHSNGEPLEPIQFPGDLSWPRPLTTGEFHIPPSWKRPR